MKKNLKIVVFLLVLIVILAGVAYTRGLYRKVIVKPNIIVKVLNPTTPTPTPDPVAPYGILLLGYGGGGHDGGRLTDTIIQAYVEPKKNTVTLITIPRDIWVNLPLGQTYDTYYKVNAAYALGLDKNQYKNRSEEFKGDAGGGQLAKYAVSSITGLPANYFIALDFSGFIKSIDTLGGIDVNVPHTFDDPLYPIEEEKNNPCGKSEEDIAEVTATMSGDLLEQEFPCRYEQLHFDKGLQHMDGTTALKFARSRKSSEYGGDFNRSLRQLAVIQAIKEKIISLNFISKAIPFAATIATHLQTDIDPSVVAEKIKVTSNPATITIKTISLDPSNVLEASKSADKQFILVPKDNNWVAIHNYIQGELNPQSSISNPPESL
jgi:LCP family protein required for cell wall assembly